MKDLFDLYQAIILDHHRNPRNSREMPSPTHSADGENPSCGDKVTVWLALANDRIVDISFRGSGCAISLASASIMTDRLKGQSVSDANKQIRLFDQILTTGQVPPEDAGDLAAFAGIHQFPARLKCARLPWQALRQTLPRTPATSTATAGHS